MAHEKRCPSAGTHGFKAPCTCAAIRAIKRDLALEVVEALRAERAFTQRTSFGDGVQHGLELAEGVLLRSVDG